MAELAKIIYEIPKGALITVGVTGTKGKSTVCEMLLSVLRDFNIKALLVGTLGINLDGRFETKNTTPESPRLFSLMKRAYESGARVAIIEVSSQALSSYRVYGIEFDILAFTSFGIDHIGNGEHKTLAEYMAAKRSLFRYYGARVAVVNYDDAYSSYFSQGIERVIKCGEGRGADYRIKKVREGFFGMRFSISGIEKSYAITGKFNAINAALASIIAMEITKAPLENVLESVSKIKVLGRFEAYNIKSRFAIIDYAHNEKSFRELMLAVRRITKAPIFAVFGSVGERTKIRRRELAFAASKYADYSFITSDNPGRESAYEIAEEIFSFYPEKKNVEIVVDRGEAIRKAFKKAPKGSVILLLGKGHEEYMLVGGERVHFSERELLFKLKDEA